MKNDVKGLTFVCELELEKICAIARRELVSMMCTFTTSNTYDWYIKLVWAVVSVTLENRRRAK